MAGRAAFKQVDLTRAVRAMRAGGLDIARVEIDPASGKIVIVSGSPATAAEDPLDKWLKEDARQSQGH